MIAEQYRILGIPMASRRARRALVVVYWALILSLCLGFVVHQSRHGVEDLNPWGLFPIFVGLAAILGGVKAGGVVKRFSGSEGISVLPTPGDEGGLTLFGSKSIFPPEDSGALDERERNERNAVHYRAYTSARWLTLALYLIYAGIGAWHAAWFPRIGPLFLFLLTLVLWSLPQMLILWNEPDFVEAR
jgi:hypothetical protein